MKFWQVATARCISWEVLSVAGWQFMLNIGYNYQQHSWQILFSVRSSWVLSSAVGKYYQQLLAILSTAVGSSRAILPTALAAFG